MVNRLPKELRSKLTKAQLCILCIIVKMCQNQAYKSPSRAMYAFPGQSWLGDQVGCTREWVSKCIQVLEALELLMSTFRRKSHGRWRTKLYGLGPEMFKILNDVKGFINSCIHRVKSSSHILNKTTTTKKDQTQKVRASHLSSKKKEDPREYFNSLITKYGPEGI